MRRGAAADLYRRDVLAWREQQKQSRLNHNAQQYNLAHQRASRNKPYHPNYIDEEMSSPPKSWSEALRDVYEPLRRNNKLFVADQHYDNDKSTHYVAYNKLWLANHRLPKPEQQLAYLQANKLAQHSQFKGLNLNHNFSPGSGAGQGTQTGAYNLATQKINLAPIGTQKIVQQNPAEDFNHESGHAASDLGQHFYKKINLQSPETYQAMQNSIDPNENFKNAYSSQKFSPGNRDRRPQTASVDEFAGYAFGNIGREKRHLSDEKGQEAAQALYESIHDYINNIAGTGDSYRPLINAIKQDKKFYDETLLRSSIQKSSAPLERSRNMPPLNRMEQMDQQRQPEEQKQEENAQENSFIKKARGGEVTRLDLYRALAASISPYTTYSDLI